MHQTEQKRYSKTTALVLCGIFAALMAICSFITIPLGFTPVPINLATLGVFLTGGILGKKYGSISLIVYILLGAVGVPVFAGFKGGLGVLAGPTGGYIIGYLAAAFLTACRTGFHENRNRFWTKKREIFYIALYRHHPGYDRRAGRLLCTGNSLVYDQYRNRSWCSPHFLRHPVSAGRCG